MKKFLIILIILLFSLGLRARADEGMWMLPLIEKLNMGRMTELGLKLSADEIYSLNQPSIKDAIVIFGGGCTGEVVSSQGLILTNHHCGYESIQSHSSVEHDYLKDGFWAMTKEQELPNPGLSVTFLRSIEDVTDQVLAGVKPGMTEQERSSVVNATRAAIERSVEGNYRVSVTSFYGGNYYYLIVYERYNDVRLVGTPPSSIGKFGFDTDNWEWPRHTGDFSVFRVYSGADGGAASFSASNVPLKPKYHLSVSIKDLNKGDFAMILGFPGRTQRYFTSWEVQEIMKITNPNRIKIRGIKQEIWMADMLADQKINIQYASKYSGSSNYWKYSIGQNNGLERLNVVSKKQQIEEEFTKWIASDDSKKEKYGEAPGLIKASIEGRSEYQNALQYISECFFQGCELLEMYQIASVLNQTLEAGDASKSAEMIKNMRESVSSFYKDYNAPTDRKVFKALMELYREDVPGKFQPDFYNTIDRKYRGSISKYVDNLFDNSIFVSEADFNAFLDKPDLKKLRTDPVFTTASSIISKAREVAANISKYDADITRGQRLWIAALKEMTPEKTQYPDANSTMRLSYGIVQDYDPRDGVTYKYYTTLQGVLDKYKPGDYEFDLPQRLIDLNNRKEFGRYASSQGYMPVNFLTTNDITGGNSGSPVLNGNGELIGLAFDGNWEAMSGDVAYEPELQRTIVVDIRYVLWVIDIYSGAGHLVDEMTIVQ